MSSPMKPSAQPMLTFSVGVRGLPGSPGTRTRAGPSSSTPPPLKSPRFRGWRAGLAGGPGPAPAVGADLFEPGLREIDHHIRCQVVGRVMHLVQHLLLDRL